MVIPALIKHLPPELLTDKQRAAESPCNLPKVAWLISGFLSTDEKNIRKYLSHGQLFACFILN
jgi:hypothetical protein